MGLTRIRAEQISDIDYKQAVRVISTVNVTLSGGAPSLVDGVTLSQGDRILVNGQSLPAQNGLYDVTTVGTGSNGTWTRTSDADATGEINAGMIVMVTEGLLYADTSWKLITNNPIIIGSTGLEFLQNTGNSFSSISVTGTTVVANGASGLVTFTSDNNISVTGNNSSDIVNFSLSNSISVSSNIAGNNILANGYYFSNGVPFTTYGNSNVANYLPTYTGNINATDITVTHDVSITGNLTIGTNLNVVNVNEFVGATGNISFMGNLLTANLSASYNLGSSSLPWGNLYNNNIYANGYYFANGTPFTSYGNSNVTAYGEAGWAGNIIPSSDAAYTLGNATNQWKSLYVSGNTVYIGGVALGSNGNSLTIGGNTIVTADPLGTSTTTGNVRVIGNITASYVLGNGSQLTGIDATSIQNGTSNVRVAANANVTVGIAGTSNVGVFSVDGLSVAGNIAATLFVGNAQGLTSLVGANVTGTVANATYAATAGSATGTAATVTTNAQPNITSVGTLTSLSVTGNIDGGNINVTNLSGSLTTAAQGNITSVGTLTSLSVSGATVVNTLQTTGNAIIGGNLVVNGNTTYVNITDLNVQDPLIDLGGGANGEPLTTNDGKDRGVLAEYYTTAQNTAWFGYKNTTGNLVAASNVTVTNNIVTVNDYGVFQVGQLYAGTGISTAGNVNADNVTTGVVSATGNVIANYIQANAGLLTGTLSLAGNIEGGNISTTGNVTATYFIGDGSLLTGIAPTVQVYEFANVISTGGYYEAYWLADYVPGPLAAFSTTVGTTATYMGGFITEVGYPNLTVIPVGTILVRIETQKASGSKSFSCYAEIYSRTAGGTETLLLTTDISTPTPLNTLVQQDLNGYVLTNIPLSLTDRIVVKIYGITSSGTDSVALHFDDNTGSGLQLPALPASSAQFVPYNNPTANVNLGSYGLTASFASVTGNLNANNVTAIANLQANIITTAGAGNITINPGSGGIVVIDTSGNLLVSNTAPATSTTTGAATFAGGIGVADNVVVGGNVYSGNILTTGIVSATGNIQGNVFIGNGSGLTNLNAANLVGAYGNSNVADYLPTYTGNLSAGNISVTGSVIGNVTGSLTGTASNAVTVTANAQPNITSVGILTSISAIGDISTAGNITGNYILGNGAFLSGVITSVANINNGTSNITAYDSGNIAVSVANVANTVVFSNTSTNFNTDISVAGNIYGNITAIGNVQQAAVVANQDNGDVNITVDGQANLAVFNTGALTMLGAYANPKSLTANVVVGNNLNGMMVGPISIGPDHSIVIPDSSTIYIIGM